MNLCLSCKNRKSCNRGVMNGSVIVDCLAYEREGVDHPSYYQGKIEVIDFIEDKQLGFHLGNAVKYIARAGKKTPDATEDIKKAIWYLERYLSKCDL